MKSCENCKSYFPLNNKQGKCTNKVNKKSAMTVERKANELCNKYVMKK